MPSQNVIPALRSLFRRGRRLFRSNRGDIARPARPNDRKAWTHELATQLWILSSEPGGNCNVPIQDHRRPALRLDSAQSTDRSKDSLLRPQPDDQPRYTDLCSNQVKRVAAGQIEPRTYSRTNAVQITNTSRINTLRDSTGGPMDHKVAQLAEQLLESGFDNFSEREQSHRLQDFTAT